MLPDGAGWHDIMQIFELTQEDQAAPLNWTLIYDRRVAHLTVECVGSRAARTS